MAGRYHRSVSTDAEILVIGAGIIGCAVAGELTAGAHATTCWKPIGRSGATQASAGMLAPYTEAHDSGPLLGSPGTEPRPLRRLDEAFGTESGVRSSTTGAAASKWRSTGAAAHLRRDRGSSGPRNDASGSNQRARASWNPPCRPHRRSPVGARPTATSRRRTSTAALSQAVVRRRRRHTESAHGRYARDRSKRRPGHAGNGRRPPRRAGSSWRADRGCRSCAGSTTRQRDRSGRCAGNCSGSVRARRSSPGWSGDQAATSCRGLTARCWSGATMEEAGFEERNTVTAVRALLEAASTLVPALNDATFVDARSGLRPATPDGLPIIGPSASSDRLFYATGISATASCWRP